jgi:hypothetical protein
MALDEGSGTGVPVGAGAVALPAAGGVSLGEGVGEVAFGTAAGGSVAEPPAAAGGSPAPGTVASGLALGLTGGARGSSSTREPSPAHPVSEQPSAKIKGRGKGICHQTVAQRRELKAFLHPVPALSVDFSGIHPLRAFPGPARFLLGSGDTLARIATQEAATRLARALASDIRLYRAEELNRGEDLSEAVAEARELYRSRVDPSLQPVFENTMAEAGLVRPSGDESAAGRAPAHAAVSSAGTLAPLETQRPQEPLPKGLFQGQASETRSQGATVPILIAILLVAAGVGFWLSLGH